MARTKHSVRKYQRGLPRACFPMGRKERDQKYKQQVAEEAEEAVAVADWTELTPSLPGPIEALERTVDRVNQEVVQPTELGEVASIVEDLYANPPTPSTSSLSSQPEEAAQTPCPFPPSPPRITAETVAETAGPILLAKRATATLKRPRPPTAATKCPRPEIRRALEEARPPPIRRKRPAMPAMSALQAIRYFQTRTDPLIPWLPFVRLIKEMLLEHGPYRITGEALKMLREIGEEHVVGVFEGANLACMHRDRCTVAPRDMHLFRRLRGDVDSLGEAETSSKARDADWQKYKEERLTMHEAKLEEARRRRQLRRLIQVRRERALRKS